MGAKCVSRTRSGQPTGKWSACVLTEQERIELSIAYNTYVNTKRSSWRCISDLHIDYQYKYWWLQK